MIAYIKEQNGKEELTDWSVVLMSKEKQGRSYSFCGHNTHLLTRGTDDIPGDDDRYSFGALAGSVDESLDLSDKEYGDALKQTQEGTDRDGRRNTDAKAPRRQSGR